MDVRGWSLVDELQFSCRRMSFQRGRPSARDRTASVLLVVGETSSVPAAVESGAGYGNLPEWWNDHCCVEPCGTLGVVHGKAGGVTNGPGWLMGTGVSRRTGNRRRSRGTGVGWGLTGAQTALLVGGCLVNVGTFSVYPYLAVLLRDRLGAGMAQVGVVLGVATLVQFASAPFTAALAERIGLKRCLLLATFVYGLGAVTYLIGADDPALTVLALLFSCGAGALYSPAYRGYLVHSATTEQRPKLLSAGNAAGNLGIALGPVVGALFLHEPGRLFAMTTALYALLAVGHLFLRTEGRAAAQAAVEPFRRVLRGLAGLPFAVTVVTHYLYMQFYQYLSTFAEGRVPTVVYGVVMMGYSIGLVAVQPLVARRVGRVGYPVAMAVGFCCMALGMGSFAGGRAGGLMVGVVVMSVGTAVLFLKNDLEALAGSTRSATVTFGQQRLAVGVGSLLSGVVGGAVYGLFERAQLLQGFWLVVAAQCVLLPPLVLVVARRSSRTR
ncbi:MFS transporter [Saccharothrix sp. BKS2]|uniref:MFS transporter n=1 Tax=Saccharothrix sp. BKS2 TaxID=3064400 RepID=UPI0039E9C7EF